MNQNAIDALKLLGTYTAGHFDVWMLAGSSKASCRAHVISTLYGRKVAQREAGVTALGESLYGLCFNHEAMNPASCKAERDRQFVVWVASLGIPVDAGTLAYAKA